MIPRVSAKRMAGEETREYSITPEPNEAVNNKLGRPHEFPSRAGCGIEASEAAISGQAPTSVIT